MHQSVPPQRKHVALKLPSPAQAVRPHVAGRAAADRTFVDPRDVAADGTAHALTVPSAHPARSGVSMRIDLPPAGRVLQANGGGAYPRYAQKAELMEPLL